MTKNTPTTPHLSRLLNEKELAVHLNISVAWLQRRRWEGGGPDFIRYGRAIRYDVAAVQHWLDTHTVSGSTFGEVI